MPTAEVSTGLRMMAQIAVIITIASGFAGMLQATGEIDPSAHRPTSSAAT